MIPIAEPLLGEEELANVVKAVKSGWISSKGEFIPRFEQQFADYCGVKHGIATTNGTTALHLALKALDIKEGDEVIVPTLTFIASANAVRYVGATPVFVDSDPRYWCMDPIQVRKKVTRKTRAIMPVHLYGHPCDMQEIDAVAKEFELKVLEDAAEAHGALCRGQKVGSFGDIGCFSFYGNKIITTGEGGMCVTNSDALATRMKILRDHGMNPTKRYWHDEIGFNYRMTNLQAAIGVAQMTKLDKFIEMKRRLAGWYSTELAKCSNIILPPEMPWARSVYWMYSILIKGAGQEQRDSAIEKLEKAGIESRPVFFPLNTMPPYKSKKRFRVAEKIGYSGVSLPSAVTLTREQVMYIANNLLSIVKEK